MHGSVPEPPASSNEQSFQTTPLHFKNGKTLLSGIDPAGRAEKTANAVLIKDRTLYFCPSVLYGYGLSVFLSRLEKEAPGSAVLCIESDPELYDLSEKSIDSSLRCSKKLHITDICDGAKLVSLVRSIWGARAFRRIETVRFTGGWQLSAELYDSLFDMLRKEIATDWSNTLTLAKLGRLYIRNTIRNLAFLPQFSSADKLSFGNTPLLVLGAGPSLDDVLDELSRNFSQSQKKSDCIKTIKPFKIICVDTCLGALKERNIVPDLVVILESQHWNLRDFIGCRGWNVPAAVDISSLPASLQILGNEGYFFSTPWTSLKIFERLSNAGFLPAGIAPLGSVGLTAVELSRRISSGVIICAGFDFSFTQDKYHARSTPGYCSKMNSQNRFKRLFNTSACDERSVKVLSKSGYPVFSSPVMRNYRDLFEQEFSGDSRLFDIEGTGLPLGIKTLSVKNAMEILLKTCENPELTGTEDKNRLSRICGDKSFLIEFLKSEIKRLEDLKRILTGEDSNNENLKSLIDECDYLWAHFPDYSGGRDPDLSNISFLKRVRAEIDPMLKLFNISLKGI